MNKEKNTVIELNIDNLGINGEGVGRWNGKTVFVKGALVGEKIKAKIIFSKPSFCVAIVQERLTDSADRTVPLCPLFLKCGGCNLQHLSYPAQLEFKRKLVQDNLQRIGKLDVCVSNTVASNKTFEYRNKMSLPVRKINDKTVIGLFAQGSHRVVECSNCFLQPKWNVDIISCVKEFIDNSPYSGYDEEKRKGDIRHVVVREVDKTLFITIVALKKIDLSNLYSVLVNKFNSFALYLNINDKTNNVILGDKWICVGEKNVKETVGNLSIKIHPASFFQVNDYIREKMYEKVVESIKNANCEVVVDAYSGAGIMSAYFSSYAKKVYAIEINEQAHLSACELIKNNNISNLYPVCGDVKDKIGGILDENAYKKTAVVIDPPRSGCDESVLKKLNECNIENLVYVSCDSATLARDLKILSEKYKIESVTPYDMFPQTSNVETLVCLSKKTEKHINIDVEFGEGEGQLSLKKLQEELNEQKPKKKTTYKDIQAYIEEKYGFKVHTAYIAEVKRDLGLPMYDAPNAVEELKRPRSHPTVEMIEAIKDALKHFEII